VQGIWVKLADRVAVEQTMKNEIIDQGLTLMLVGMGTVFTFLTLLVIATSLMSLIIRRMTPASATAGATDEEVAAISAAITIHGRRQQQK